jgi:hypothetical protein
LSLIASALFALSHSDELLGVHQANLLFRDRTQITLTRSEWIFLLRSAIGRGIELVPGWFWLRQTNNPKNTIIYLAVADSNSAVRAGALRLISDLSLAMTKKDKRRLFEKLIDDGDERSKREVLMWLRDCGKPVDLEFVERLADDKQSGVSSVARDVAIKILSRTSQGKMVEYIASQSAELNDQLLLEVGSNVDDNVLNSMLIDKSKNARRFAILVLNSRGSLSRESATGLLKDDSSAVREIALRAAIAMGALFDAQFVRDTMPKPIGLLGFSSQDDVDNLLFEMYSNESFDTLQSRITWGDTDGSIAYKAIANYHYEKCRDIIISDIESNFERIKKDWEERIRSTLGRHSEGVLHKWEGLHQHIRGQFTRAALSAIATHGDKADEPLMRRFLKSDNGDILFEVGRFIGRHAQQGNNGTVREILGLAERAWSHSAKLVGVAFELADDPHTFIIDTSISVQIRKQILALLDRSQTIKLKEHWQSLLTDEDDGVRKRTIQKVFECTTQKQRVELLNRYFEEAKYYYYDVVFWLDRLTYAPNRWQSKFAAALSRRIDNPYSL